MPPDRCKHVIQLDVDSTSSSGSAGRRKRRGGPEGQKAGHQDLPRGLPVPARRVSRVGAETQVHHGRGGISRGIFVVLSAQASGSGPLQSSNTCKGHPWG
eukprot:746463-Hanusia_phi.AAC.11